MTTLHKSLVAGACTAALVAASGCASMEKTANADETAPASDATRRAIVDEDVAALQSTIVAGDDVVIPKHATALVIDKNKRSPFNDGVFQGWGTSFCWWANRVGYSDTLAERTARLFYTLDHKGLGLNIIRYNIGGGDDPSHHHITRTDSAVPGFLAADGSYDWTRDAAQRNCLLHAAKVCASDVIVEAFSNSPPYFMTVSGCSSGNADASKNNLRADQYDAFAAYLATVVAHYKSEWGISFQSLSPMNEPATNYWGANSNKQEGCHFDAGESQSRLLVATRAALDAAGLDDVLVCGSDETSTATAVTSFEALTAEARTALGRVDSHTYNYPAHHDDESLVALRNAASAADKNLWMSEVDKGGTAGVNAGEMGAPLELALRIITDLNGLQASAWVIWDIIDSHISSDGYHGNQDGGAPKDLRGGYWGIATADHDSQTLLVWKKYYGFAQFTRYIRAGYNQLPLASDTVLAFYSEAEEKLVIVAVNDTASDSHLALDLSSFAALPRTAHVVRTSGATLADGENLAAVHLEIAANGKTLYPPLKANSITTFVFEGVE